MGGAARRHPRVAVALTPPPATIVVLGGGTAGWMAACLLAKAWGPRGAAVTVIESPEIGIVGVGEGSTPQLKAFFDTLGIAEAEWMPRCNATYKTGIGFHGWSHRRGYESYFHPFPTALDGHTAPAFFAHAAARRAGHDVEALPDRFFVPAWLAAHGKAPLPADNFPFAVGYGYHFDAHLIGAFLREHATTTQGVVHVERRIVDVVVTDGAVAALVAEGGERITADLFVDSSGFRAVIATALRVPFEPYINCLFNERAVVIPTVGKPYRPRPSTLATALSGGWAWDIPLTNRTGNGYVYASRYLDADAAETELRAHLGLLDSPTAARHLTMRVGRVATTWTANCLAVGLSQGFLEPLEATALHIVQATVESFIDAHDRGGAGERAAFNARIAARYDGIRDYIVAHYRLNQRTDTEYWRDNAANANLSDSLRGVMTAWFTGADLAAEIERQGIADYYAPISWGALLAGYGTFPADARLRPAPAGAFGMAGIDDFVARCGSNFPDHAAALARSTAS